MKHGEAGKKGDGRWKREEGRKEGKLVKTMEDGRGDEKRTNKIRTVIELTDSGQEAAETQTWLEFSFQCN